MKLIAAFLICSISLLTFCRLSGKQPRKINIGAYQTLQFTRQHISDFVTSLENLDVVIKSIHSKAGLLNAQKALQTCRINYKQLEFFLEYFLPYPSNIYNRPTTYEIEVPFAEYQTPIGLQVIESYLYDENTIHNNVEVLAQISTLIESAHELPSLLSTVSPDDATILESVRLEFIRISSLGLTNYDTPLSFTALQESQTALLATASILAPYLKAAPDSIAGNITVTLQKAIRQLNDQDFQKFDRMAMLKDVLLPLQRHLTLLINSLALEHQKAIFVNYNSTNIFSGEFINLNKEWSSNKAIIDLGKQLFFSTALSGNQQRSCASCHSPSDYFADGLVRNITLDKKASLFRNTPSLLYASFQHRFFLDGRAETLQNQAASVIGCPNEMMGDTAAILRRLIQDSSFKLLFHSSFPDAPVKSLHFQHILQALSAYEATLAPFSSPFDAYMNGNRQAMTKQQVRGFNLFMGKAQCGTCHFLPLFNGLLPPYYDATEFEILGTSATSDFHHPIPDKDSGLGMVIPMQFTTGAFKTPTLRNVEKTAPYMHNSAFNTLTQVITFYNKGGGNGIGLSTAQQTLSSIPLHLTAKEIRAINSFLSALTDSLPTHLNSLQ